MKGDAPTAEREAVHFLAAFAATALVAVATPALGDGMGSSARVVELSLAPDEAVPRLAVNRSAVTTVTFFDASGAPWPIAALHVSAGAPTAQREPTHPHVATLRTDARRSAGNVVAFLEGLSEPVHLALSRDAPAASRVRVAIDRLRGRSTADASRRTGGWPAGSA